MAQNKNRKFDRTHLSIDAAEERVLIHRDYLAHCFRWSHTLKCLLKGKKYDQAVILDVGCGREMPLAKLLYVNKMTPGLYVGVDINKMDIAPMLKGKKIPIRLYSETDICSLSGEDVGMEFELEEGEKDFMLPDLITCYEVFEHVTPAYGRKMLEHFRTLIEPKYGTILISTPCWNGSAAENHISETKYEAFGALIEDLGFEIQGHYGTFASISDYEDALKKDSESEDLDVVTIHEAFARLREYYDSNVLAVIFAPLYPQHARNCIWRLGRSQPADYERKFPPLAQVLEPWTQHEDWKELAGDPALPTHPLSEYKVGWPSATAETSYVAEVASSTSSQEDELAGATPNQEGDPAVSPQQTVDSMELTETEQEEEEKSAEKSAETA